MAPEMINAEAGQIKAAGGVLVNAGGSSENPDILLIFRNNVWDLPKGKLEEGESIAGCATREVSEEVGLSTSPDILGDLGTTRHTYTEKGQIIEKETFWFVMQLPEHVKEFTPQVSEGISKVRWVPVDRALEKVGYKNLEDVIQKFIDHIDNLSKINRS